MKFFKGQLRPERFTCRINGCVCCVVLYTSPTNYRNFNSQKKLISSLSERNDSISICIEVEQRKYRFSVSVCQCPVGDFHL